jgi:hypothetical protein
MRPSRADLNPVRPQPQAGELRGFTFGVEFDDRYGLLKGVGKHARHVKIKKLADANQDALRYYIQQAVERDAR